MSDEMEVEDPVRPNSVFIRGVDNLATADIKAYLRPYTEEFFKIEWINDTSLNVVFEDNSSAKALLNALTPDEVDKELIPELTERDAKQYDKSKPEIEFKVRMTRWDDKKVKNASQYSRYYLLNPDAEKRTRRERRTGGGYRDREHRARRPIADDEDLFPNKVTADDFYGERREESKEGSDKSGDLLNRITIKSSKGSDDLLSRIGTPDKSSTKKGDDNDLLSRLN